MISRYLLCFAVLISCIPSCAAIPTVVEPHPGVQDFSTREVHARFVEGRTAPASNAAAHSLIVLVAPIGIDFSSVSNMLKTFHTRPRGGKSKDTVGHSWVMLCEGGRCLECGHSGEHGFEDNNYYHGALALARAGDPNPAKALFRTMDDGEFVTHSSGHTPLIAVRFWLTEQEYAKTREFIAAYDYKHFALTKGQCTSFAAGVAAAAGIELGSGITLALPRVLSFKGTEYVFWTEPQYSSISFSAPEVLEQSLLLALEQGLGEDALEWYRRGTGWTHMQPPPGLGAEPLAGQ